MKGISLKRYYKLFRYLGISPQEVYRLYFWILTKEQTKQRFKERHKYLEEYRNHFIDFEYVKNIDSHKCIGKHGEHYIFFPDEERVLIDPWELIDREFSSDINKIKETTGDHVYFQILYNIPNQFQNIRESRYTILRLLQLLELYPSTDKVSDMYNPNFSNLTGFESLSINRLCLNCFCHLDYDPEEHTALFCLDKSKKNHNNCYEQFLNGKSWFKKLSSEPSNEQWRQHYNNIAKKVSSRIYKQFSGNPIYRPGYKQVVGADVHKILMSGTFIKKNIGKVKTFLQRDERGYLRFVNPQALYEFVAGNLKPKLSSDTFALQMETYQKLILDKFSSPIQHHQEKY